MAEHGRPAELIRLESDGGVHTRAGRKRRGFAGQVPGFKRQSAGLLAQGEAEVLLLPDRGRAGDLGTFQGEKRGWIPAAERRERQDLGAFAAEAVRRAAARLGQAPAVGLCHAADLAALQAATPTVRLASSRYVQRRGLMLAAGRDGA